jgi:hypothetical protein
MSKDKQTGAGMIQTISIQSEDSDVIPYSVLLVLGDAFSDPRDVAYFLRRVSIPAANQHRLGTFQRLTCSLSLTHAYMTACVNCWVKTSFDNSISF